MTTPESLLRIVIVGHVDHGKSTLVGRLLYDTGHLSQAKIDHIHASSKKRGMQVEWAFALDALQALEDDSDTISTKPSHVYGLGWVVGHTRLLLV